MSQAREFAFIDSTVCDVETLLAHLRPGVQGTHHSRGAKCHPCAPHGVWKSTPRRAIGACPFIWRMTPCHKQMPHAAPFQRHHNRTILPQCMPAVR